MKRQVRIVHHKIGNSWAVEYVHRVKGQHYCAARFYAPDNPLEKVEEWVRNNHKLELVKD